ncbi:MAG TPA: glycoside hydrolase domain-containing protein [Solirubrobacterales bacterium]
MTRAHRPAFWPLLLPLLVLAVLLIGPAQPAGAATRMVHFDGRTVQIPQAWPVYRLDRHPRMCVRMDRRAVYLGAPSARQQCPAEAIGRQRAILVEPRTAARASAQPWARRKATTSAAGSVFTGLGFDACTAPSSRSMAAWASSPYRAVGVYIGGINRACSQPNLTSTWVAAQTEAGWHLIPTYVGLQAPTSACSSCAKLSSSQATAQGAAAAVDAVADASAVAMGPGSPIYYDMEAYSQTSSATTATLAFLEAWTQELHRLGYSSGVYSSSASGIEDLARQIGTGYELPDAIWTANWNGQQNTADPVVPADAWASHQRIHQYQGGHNESYGGVTINIDNNYVDGPTVGTASLAGGDDPIGYLDLAGSPAPGQVRVRGWAYDPNAPTEPLAIRLSVGGKIDAPGVAVYDLGPVANRSRRDVATQFPEAGPRHGFDLSLPTVKSGRQRVCAYALDWDPGEDRLLGCKGASIPVAVKISQLGMSGNRVRVRVTCLWPAGTACPGQILLRTRFRVPVANYRGRGPRTRPVSRMIGRSPFSLSGRGAQTFRVPLTTGGRTLLRGRGSLKTHVVVAIPGGRRVAVLEIKR